MVWSRSMPDHRCDERTIDYTRVEQGYLVCEICGREWTLTAKGWIMSPREPAPPRNEAVNAAHVKTSRRRQT